MSRTTTPPQRPISRFSAVKQTIARLESVPYDTLVATPARIFIAATFWLSGRTKVDGLISINQSAFFLFEHEYALPVIPSRLAAYLATYAEHLFPVLLVIGFASRLSAAALFLMALVIQVFVYPDAWRTHLLWASALAFVVFRGPGTLSVDHLIRKRYDGTSRTATSAHALHNGR